MELSERIKDLRDELISLRRDFHKYPELGFQEERTAGKIAEYLKKLGLEVKTGVAKTGVVGLLRGAKDGKTIMIRVDMDALPIQELNDVDYASQNKGVMHACGHDGHTAIALITAKLLSDYRDALNGNVKFIFQPSEEAPPGGAKLMIKEGALEDPKVDMALALHLCVGPEGLRTGEIGVAPGVTHAASDRFEIIIKGKGGHGAGPSEAIDPIVISSAVVLALQTIVSREIDPLEPVVLTVGRISGGTADNIIPEEVHLSGTVRTLDNTLRESMPLRIERIVKGITEAHRASYQLDYRFGYPPLQNDKNVYEIIKELSIEIVGEGNLFDSFLPSMGAEDFAYFLQRVPGCMFGLGATNLKKGFCHPHHSPNFDFDEEALPIGVEIFSRIVLKLLRI